MLKSITLKNFKSYRAASLHLAPLTFLIGPNASGKSNALEAIRLLSWLARGKRLEDIARDLEEAKSSIRGNIRDLFGNKQAPLNFELDFSDEDSTGNLLISVKLAGQLVIGDEELTGKAGWMYRIKGEAKPYTDEIAVEYNNYARGGKKPTIHCSNRQPVFYQLQTANRFPHNHKKLGQSIAQFNLAIKNSLDKVFFLDPKPAKMRGYAGKYTTTLDEDGANLSGVLFKLVEADKKKDLLAFIRFLPEQNFTDIDFVVVKETNDVMVRLVESFGDKQSTINATLLSDGTLRVMAIAAVLLGAPKGSLVVIEEVDNGVHPSRAKDLVAEIKKVAQENSLQVLLTSHNPAMIDVIPEDAIGDIIACYRNPKDGDSRLTRLKDLNDFAELVAQGPVGELMKRQILDKYLKPEASEAEKVAENLAWLDNLMKETAS